MKPLMGLAIVRLAASDKDIPEIKRRLMELKKEIEDDSEFWDEFFSRMTKKEEK